MGDEVRQRGNGRHTSQPGLFAATAKGGTLIYAVDRNFAITAVNDAWDVGARASGAPEMQSPAVLGTNLLDWIHGPEREEVHHICEAIFAGEINHYASQIDYSLPGEPRIFTLRITPARDEQGQVSGAIFESELLTEAPQARPGSGPQQALAGPDNLTEQLREQHAALVRERSRAQALSRIILTLNQSLSMQTTVHTLLQMTTELIDAPAAAVYLISEDHQRLIPWASRGIDLQSSDPAAFQLATSAAGRALNDERPFEIADTLQARDFAFVRFGNGDLPRSLYVVPLSTYRGPVGVLEVYAPVPRSLNDEQRELLDVLAASAGIAITNAYLYDHQVHARKDAEQNARLASQQAAQLRATVESMTDGVWICDREGTLLSVNEAGLKMFQLQRGEVVGKPIAVLAQLFDIGRGERRRLGLRLALQGEVLHLDCDVNLHGASKPLTVDVRATPVRDQANQVIGAVAVVRDMTHARAMERVKEEFLSLAAHELKTPITALKGYTQLAVKRAGDQPDPKSMLRTLKTIDEQADRITGLVQKLLDVSRLHSGHLELQFTRFDLCELIASMVEQARLIAPSHVIETHVDQQMMIVADPLRIEQVLYNLLSNAIKYSPQGGPIQIEATIVDECARIAVHDRGVGIPPDKLPYVFDRWYQAHHNTYGDYGGMGLGLYICKAIVEEHGGDIWATSPESGGTTVRFTIPVEPARQVDCNR